MATITKITEPKTFQQIQTQQNELGKEAAFENLNNNISKLITAINNQAEKRLSESDKQLKENQLALSKLQLRRAQLGFEREKKYTTERSLSYNEKTSNTTSLGGDLGGNSKAVAASLLTGGMVNPVVMKQVLFPLAQLTKDVVTNVASFSGLIPMMRGKVSGKTSSAVDSSESKTLFGKLDQILGALKNKTRKESKQEKEEESAFSKFLKTMISGAIGAFMIAEMVADGGITETLKQYGPAMIAGFALGGWKGALLGFALQLGAEAFGLIKNDTKENPTIITNALKHINTLLKPFGIALGNDEFKAITAGLMLGGVKGAFLAYTLKRIGSVMQDLDGDNDTPGSIDTTKVLNNFFDALGLEGENRGDKLLPIIGGFMYGGVKGAVLGYSASQIMAMYNTQKELSDAIKKGDKLEQDKLEKELQEEKYRLALSGAFSGLMYGGPVGAVLGGVMGLFGSDILQAYNKYGNIGTAFDAALETDYLGVPTSIWVGCLTLASLGLKSGLGLKGAIVGAVIGTIGGFIADRYRSKQIIENAGFEAEWRSEELGYVIKDAEDIDIYDLRRQIREDLYKEHVVNAKNGKIKEVTQDEVDAEFKKRLTAILQKNRKFKTQDNTLSYLRGLDKRKTPEDVPLLLDDSEMAAYKQKEMLQSFLYGKGLLEKGWFGYKDFDVEKNIVEMNKLLSPLTGRQQDAVYRRIVGKSLNTPEEEKAFMEGAYILMNQELYNAVKNKEIDPKNIFKQNIRHMPQTAQEAEEIINRERQMKIDEANNVNINELEKLLASIDKQTEATEKQTEIIEKKNNNVTVELPPNNNDSVNTAIQTFNP